MFILQVAMVKGQGGITTAVQHYARMFDRAGVAHAIVFRGPAYATLGEEGFAVFPAPDDITAPWRSLLPLSALRDAVRERAKSDVTAVIVHSDLALGAMARTFPEAKLVTPCHSDKFKHKKRANLVVSLNVAQQSLMRSALAGEGPHVAMLGNPFVPKTAAAATAGDGPPRVNFVGRFTETKDPLALVAAAKLMKTSPAPEFRFIGSGELDEPLRAAAAAAGTCADFAGWLASPFSHFHRNDILVLPSSWEGLPYLLLEALDRGVPIIASDIAGNRAALADGAYGALYPLGDAVQLAARIDFALGDLNGLRAKAEKGRASLSARYGADAFWRALQGELGLATEPALGEAHA